MEAETDTKDLATTTPLHIFWKILSKNLKQTGLLNLVRMDKMAIIFSFRVKTQLYISWRIVCREPATCVYPKFEHC